MRGAARALACALPLVLAACGAAAPGGVAGSAAGCRVVTRADVPADISGGQIAVVAAVNGRPVRLRVATAMAAPLVIGSEVAASLRLPKVGQVPLQPGGTQRLDLVGIDRLSLGTVEQRGFAAPVTAQPFPTAGRPAHGSLGWGFLGGFDVEIDPAARRLRLHEVKGCGEDFSPLPEPHFSLRLHRDVAGVPLVPIRLDGTPCLVTLSTGFDTSEVTRDAALRAGVTEAELAADPTVTSTYLDGPRACPVHRFREVEIGEHVFRDVRLEVVEPSVRRGDGALGGDYLLRHRLWISPGTGRVYIARRTAEPGG